MAKFLGWHVSRLWWVAPLVIAGCGGDSGNSSSDSNTGSTDAVVDVVEAAGFDENYSIARVWNEVLLEAIRDDFARPTVHARNLYHISSAMYDAWSVYSDEARPYLLRPVGPVISSSSVSEFQCDLEDFPEPPSTLAARQEAISYAAYRMIRYRFRLSPGVLDIEENADATMELLGYDKDFESQDYSDGSPAALGNYIANCYIEYGLQDGSNEQGFFENEYYEPVNPDIVPVRPGNPNIVDLDRWQPIALPFFIDQSGNLIDTKIEFLSPEWGQVVPFALTDDVMTPYERDGFTYEVYYDPGMPPTMAALPDLYKWGFSLVSVWSAQLDPFNGPGTTMIDISPGNIGNPNNADASYYPASFDEYADFYNLFDGGDPSTGYEVNPFTGAPYEPQMVPLGDYARVLAEFWADGPDSETPPGHWFVILNEVGDDPNLVRRYEGVGPELDRLEWDIKLYFTMGGTMHDAAIAAWGIKGWYDYVRPISAIRALADRGQSSDMNAPSYSPDGIPLYEGYIELIDADDPLAGNMGQHVGKIKVYAWRGPSFIEDEETDQAGVGWIRAENWWPYQRPSFVTPPFAGYVSGHSTYSRAAAEVMTLFTGDAYFPGGKSGFEAKQNEFLVFEEGPSVDLLLEWATYRDASDQCSLSRIWGGIHPPADDIPGRLIGREIGPAGFEFAKSYFGP